MADVFIEPIALDDAKANLRVTADDEDDLISDLIVAAREHVEDYTGLVLTPRTVTETAQRLGRWIDLTSWPVNAVTAIRYPLAGVQTALAEGAWLLSTKRRPVRILPATFGWGVSGDHEWYCRSSALPVEIDVDAGFATPEDVPQAVKQAMHLLISHLYTNRGAAEVGTRAAAVEIPFGVEALLRRWRLVSI